MTHAPDADDFRAKLHRLESLVQQAERLTDPAARALARELVQGLLDLHAAGLDHLLGHVADAGAAGDAILDACTADDVVGGMLLLHGLHPLGVEERVRQAVEEVGPSIRSHGGEIELLEIEDGVVRLRFEADHGHPASAAVRQAVEEAVIARAPDVTGIEIEGLEADATANGRVALPLL